MSRIILDEPGDARIARRPIRIDASVSVGGAAGGAAVELHAERDGARVGWNPSARAVELPEVGEAVVLRVTPAGGDAFPDNAAVTVVVRTSRTDDGAEDTVTVSNVDVAGRSFRDVATVAQEDERTLRVRRLVGADTPLGPVAAQARAIARGLLGFEGRGEQHGGPVDVLVLVDTSASMVAATLDGRLEAAVDTVVGVAQVLVPGRTPVVRLTGGEAPTVEAAPPAELAGATVRAAAGCARGSGFRSVVAGRQAPARTLVYVVTDDVPADVALLAEAGGAERLHRILLVEAAAAVDTVDVPVAVLPPPPRDVPVTDHLARSAQAMAAVVRPMVAGFERSGALR